MKHNKKPLYLKVRVSRIRKIGGAHRPLRGGKYYRSKEKSKSRKDIEAELK